MAETKITGVCLPFLSCRKSSTVSKPSISGIWTSTSATANSCSRINAKASFPEDARTNSASRSASTLSRATRFLAAAQCSVSVDPRLQRKPPGLPFEADNREATIRVLSLRPGTARTGFTPETSHQKYSIDSRAAFRWGEFGVGQGGKSRTFLISITARPHPGNGTRPRRRTRQGLARRQTACLLRRITYS